MCFLPRNPSLALALRAQKPITSEKRRRGILSLPEADFV
jgi:hypothetical protein